jgi:hypothetical protein
LPTNDHFSSNWISRVLGGKSHEFVVEFLGVLPGDHGQADYGILVNPHQATGLTHATTLVQVLEDGQGFVLGPFGAIQGCAFALGEAVLAGAAGQDASVLVGAVAKAHAQVVTTTLAIVGTVEVLAAEVCEVVHGAFSQSKKVGKVAEQLTSAYKVAAYPTSLLRHDRKMLHGLNYLKTSSR